MDGETFSILTETICPNECFPLKTTMWLFQVLPRGRLFFLSYESTRTRTVLPRRFFLRCSETSCCALRSFRRRSFFMCEGTLSCSCEAGVFGLGEYLKI